MGRPCEALRLAEGENRSFDGREIKDTWWKQRFVGFGCLFEARRDRRQERMLLRELVGGVLG